MITAQYSDDVVFLSYMYDKYAENQSLIVL